MDSAGRPRSFPLPSQIEDVPGAENWRSMYPYFTRFQPGDDQRFWFYNSMHFPEPMPAFDAITAEIPYTAIGANTTRVFDADHARHRAPDRERAGLHHRYPGHRPGRDRPAGRDLQRAGRLLLPELGPPL